MVTTRCVLLFSQPENAQKCVGGRAPDPAGGAYSAPPDPLARLRDPTSKGRRGRRGEGREMPSSEILKTPLLTALPIAGFGDRCGAPEGKKNGRVTRRGRKGRKG